MYRENENNILKEPLTIFAARGYTYTGYGFFPPDSDISEKHVYWWHGTGKIFWAGMLDTAIGLITASNLPRTYASSTYK